MKRWPIIRHVRYLLALHRFNTWWDEIGCYLGAVPNPADLAHLKAIWGGRA